MITVENISKRYGRFLALDEINFQVEAGQIAGFLGPNGAGKTTMIRILTGYLPPSSGEALVAGHAIGRESMDVRRQIGYLPESVPLYPDMTVQGYVEYMAALRGVRRKKQAARQALERVDLADRAHSLIRQISKGMRQRVGLAQAIVHDPPVLILDEPTIGLDPQQVRDVRHLVRELGQDHTILFSTHILSEAEQICDQVIIINRGKIIAQGHPQQLHEQLQSMLQSVQSSGRIFVRVREQPARLQAILSTVEGVAQVDTYQHGVLVQASGGQEIRPALAAAVARASLELLELRPVGTSLEELFIELTEHHG